MKILKLTIMLLAIVFYSCANKETTENKNILIEKNDAVPYSNNTDNPNTEFKERKEFIISMEGAILYHNKDTLTVYKNNSNNSESFIIDHEYIFLKEIEETPGWYSLISTSHDIEGYINIYNISENNIPAQLYRYKSSCL